MKSQVILCLALVLSGSLLGCSTASSPVAGKLDLAAYRIERVPSTNAVPLEGINCKEWQNFLVFSNSNISVPLVRSATEQGRLYAGLDPKRLKLQWLKPGELLWISWSTLYQGSGGYTHDGNVILQIRNGQGRQLFRDNFESLAKAGLGSQYSSALTITYQNRRKTFTFTRSYNEIQADMGLPDPRHPLLFTTTFTNDNVKTFYISTVRTIDTWHYKLVRNKLKFLRGSSALDLGDEPQSIEEVVNGFHVTRAALELMNPSLGNRRTATGILVIDEKLKPYEVSSEDALD